jgi:heat shock protein HslJ
VTRFPSIVVGAAILAAGVALSAAAASTGARGTATSALTGKVWILATLGGKAPLKGTELTSEFGAKLRVSGSAGCNRYTGAYRVSGTTIRITALATTKKACTQAIERQEAAFLKGLTGSRSFAVSGGALTLKSAGGRALATFKAQTQALGGTAWDVLAYNNGKQAVVSVLAKTKLTATFGKDGNLTGFAGCNDYNASYKVAASKVSIGPVATTRKSCEEPAGVGEQEAAYLAAVQTAATYRVEGSQLELRTADGALAVELHRR